MPQSPKDPRIAARSYAYKLLSYRSRSRKEMLDKLRTKGFESEDVNAVMEFLETSGLINDAELASELLSYSARSKPLGKNGIKMLMLKRGLDKGLVDETLSGHTLEMEEDAAMEFAERKFRVLNNYPAKVARRRLWAMLQRRGFSAGIIRKAVDSVIG
ncbi:regulatory protein RecX [bacterium BMS3Abin09]|nr:regulatory protein RecX [bacterium BMS3Abin09]GBE40771.1 regulatory protein RecX [bacterium BMS3Bbin09]HDH33826.1 regulatory protein RecX [Nitrospirota bacterium]HDN95035.1 regulatory protein RecX [Nitrospirota bacterium]HDO66930.1 regulatory protein RecX [Nitrospirota bacterium]